MDTRTVTTVDLKRGDRVVLPGRLIRTFSHTTDTGLVNHHGQPILAVWYAEGRTDDWGPSNTATATSMWSLA